MTIFRKAVPVWKKDSETEKNLTLIFRSILPPKQNCNILLSCSSIYQLFINGNFVATGPARAAHNIYKADTIDISPFLTKEKNVVTVYVAGYNVKSFYLLNQPSFLCAEIISGDEICAATGYLGFKAKEYTERVTKVQRYSYQRPFCEVYKTDNSFRRIDTDPEFTFIGTHLAECAVKSFVPRDVYYCDYQRHHAKKIKMQGQAIYSDTLLREYNDRSITHKDAAFAFDRAELEIESTREAGKIDFFKTEKCDIDFQKTAIDSSSFKVFDMGINNTGLINMDITVRENTILYLTFDEILKDGFVDYTRMECCNVIIWHLKKGNYTLTSFEPYTLRYLCISSIGGNVEISNLNMISVGFPRNLCRISQGKEKLDLIYNAAVESFRQNVLDIYMDCPSRERAGWLCDSFFIARAEYELTGKSVVEKAFLKNFIASAKLPGVPDGMLPMCYPSDSIGTHCIPNWAMWFVLELEEYLERTNDRKLIDNAEETVYGILNYLKKYENQKGLLEKLEGWIFVEWSQANKLVQDINFPTNMLYARFKETIAKLYSDKILLNEAEKLHAVIRELSYFDGFFHDRAIVSDNGTIKVTDEITETCQYYAFYMNTATPDTFNELWNTMVTDFGPHRKDCNKWENVYFANAFIGNYLRLDLLAQNTYQEQLENEIEGYFYNMAQTTGTLWEHDNTFASCNHGFTSHIVVWLGKGR